MFDVGFFELVILAVVGLLVLGPERLPHAVRMGAAYLGKFRRAVMTVREEFEREVNVQEMQKRIQEQMEKTGLPEAQKSLQELKQSVESGDPLTENRIDGGTQTAPTPKAVEPKKDAPTKTAEAETHIDPNTQHSPTLPENEAEPFPSEEKPKA